MNNCVFKNGIYWFSEPITVEEQSWVEEMGKPTLLIMNDGRRTNGLMRVVAYTYEGKCEGILGKIARTSNGLYLFKVTCINTIRLTPVG